MKSYYEPYMQVQSPYPYAAPFPASPFYTLYPCEDEKMRDERRFKEVMNEFLEGLDKVGRIIFIKRYYYCCQRSSYLWFKRSRRI